MRKYIHRKIAEHYEEFVRFHIMHQKAINDLENGKASPYDRTPYLHALVENEEKEQCEIWRKLDKFLSFFRLPYGKPFDFESNKDRQKLIEFYKNN